MTRMPNTGKLLVYNAKHKVVLCLECKYAVQKSALGSHLLRHKIYRGERQQILSSLAQLEVLEPDDVELPPTGSSPIDGIPTIPGFKCTAPGCHGLCASRKRMRRHWSEVHGVSDPPASFAREASLQTFFRGTKLKYFEVDSRRSAQESLNSARDVVELQSNSAGREETPAPIFPSLPQHTLDLEALNYFHHFTTQTSFTLPTENQDSPKHWQMDVVAHALRLSWLMSGLLAISTSHLAALSTDETTILQHGKQSAHYFRDFASGWEKMKQDAGVRVLEEAPIAAQMFCTLRLCQGISKSRQLDRAKTLEIAIPPYTTFIATVQGCTDPGFALHYAASNDELTEDTFIRTSTIIEESPENSNNVPPALLPRFRTLPYRIASVTEKPSNPNDFFATMSAIDALARCTPLTFIADDPAAAWKGMVSWLSMLLDHFKSLLWHKNDTALVVLAHWAMLVKRAEESCWFLRGSAARLLEQILGAMAGDSALRSLVGDLGGGPSRDIWKP